MRQLFAASAALLQDIRRDFEMDLLGYVPWLVILAVLALAGCGIAGTDRSHVTSGSTAVAYSGPLCGSSQQSLLDLSNATDHEVTGKCWVRTITAPDGTVTQESGIEISASSQATAAQQATADGTVAILGALGAALGQTAGIAARTAAGFGPPVPEAKP